MHRTSFISRRQFNAGLAAAPWLASCSASRGAEAGTPRLKAIVHQGMLIADSIVPGETRADNVTSAHPNGIQLAKNRFLVLYATRGFRGIDDDRAICYQLRSEGFDGPVLKEGLLSKPYDLHDLDTSSFAFKQHGHPVAFGVPKGAKIAGRDVPHAGLFVAKWRTRSVNIKLETLVHDSSREGQGVEWVQFRLKDDESDIKILQPVKTLRQKYYEAGPLICEASKYGWMNQSYVNAVPYNAECNEWIDANHFAGDRVATLRYRFDHATGLYEWVETGDYLIDPLGGVSEASVVRWGDDWLIGVRLAGAPIDKPGRPKRAAHGLGWLRTSDPMRGQGEIAFPPVPNCQGGRTAYRCADGVLRVFAGDATVPPKNGKPRSKRNPIYAWDVDPDRAWAASEPRVIFDAWKAEIGMRPDSVPMCDMIKLMPPTGNSQVLLHRLTFAPNNYPPTSDEIAACGVYAARLEYDSPVASAWQFA
jgi:hypothetical protein